MSSVSGSFCPGCGIEPPLEGGLCTHCKYDRQVLGALEAWVESSGLQSTFTVRGVNLTRALTYPLMKAAVEELVRQERTEGTTERPNRASSRRPRSEAEGT